MVNGKQAISLMEQTTKYVLACSKKSILECKSYNLNKIEPNKLGFILPNGHIQFQSGEFAYEYAKNKIIKHLLSEKPTEYGVLIRGRSVIAEKNGKKYGVDCKDLGLLDRVSMDVERDTVMLHGHPDLYGSGRTTPISGILLGDIAVAVKAKLKSILAFNSKGEFNRVEFNKNFPKEDLDRLLSTIDNAFDEFYITKLLSSKEVKRYKKLLELKRELINFPEELEIELNKLREKYQQKRTECRNKEIFAKIYHEFYSKYLEKYGIEYSTNFANLIEK